MNTKQLASFRPAAFVVGLCLLLAASASQAGLLQTQSNPVNFGGYYWGSPASWEALGIPHFQWDTPGDGTHNRDINFVSIAHDDWYFYVRINFNQAPSFNGNDFGLWLDTDLDPNSGTRNFTGTGAIGADLLVWGAALIDDIPAWHLRGWVGWDQSPWTSGDLPRDVIISLDRTTLVPGITTFDFTYQLHNSSDGVTGDWYPDAANALTGDYFRYTTTPTASPTASSQAYQKLVRNDGALAYYRLNETAPFIADVATNGGSLGGLGQGTYTIGARHPVAGAIAGDADAAARFSAVDSSSTDGGVPVMVLWPENPLIRELWDNVGVGVLDGKGGGTTSLGFENNANWHVNLGHIIKVAQDFDITTPPGPPYSRGQKAGLWLDGGDLGGLDHVWDTRSWATRQLASGAQINFDVSGEYWITVRINNGGDTAMGVGLASGSDGSAEFIGVGSVWNNYWDDTTANNSLCVSAGTLGAGKGPYGVVAHGPTSGINGRGLIVAHLITQSGGNDTIEAAVFLPGDVIPTEASGFVPQVSYSFASSMLATHLLVWLNGDTSVDPYGGELDAIRVTKTYTAMFHGQLNTSGSFSIEAWLRPTIEGAGNAQSPLFNRDPSDSVANRAGWDFFQRDSATGWNFRMFTGSGNNKVFNVTGGPYTIGNWCHLAAVYDASGPNVSLYLNGALVGGPQSPLTGAYTPTSYAPLSIGGYSDASQNPFTGDIDEVALYTNALSSAQVLAHYQNGTNAARGTPYSSLILSDGAVEYLRLNESGQNLATNSGTLGPAANGIYDAYVAKGGTGPRMPGFEADNTASFFNRYNSYVELGNPAALNFSGQITLEAWVQLSATPASGYGDIIAHGYDEDYNEVALRVESATGGYKYSISTYKQWQGEGASADVPLEDLGTGAWVLLVGTYDGVSWNLYRNGTLLASAADSSGTGSLLVSKGNWAVGARGRWAHMDVLSPGLDRTFQGKIDEAAIYSTALSADQVLAHYLVGKNGLWLSISRSGTDVILTWPAGTLQQSDTADGTYSDVSATSPHTVSASGKKFFRVRL